MSQQNLMVGRREFSADMKHELTLRVDLYQSSFLTLLRPRVPGGKYSRSYTTLAALHIQTLGIPCLLPLVTNLLPTTGNSRNAGISKGYILQSGSL